MKPNSMLQTNSPAGQIRDLVELYFQDLQAFGLLASHIRPGQESFEGYIVNHIANINSLIQGAEEHYNLTPDNKLRPILYNYRSWPENTPIAGYYAADSPIKYSHLLATYVGNWQNEFSHGPSYSRLLRAALWMWHNSGLKHSLNYLFDLQKYGYFTFSESIEEVIALLLRSQAPGKNDQEIIAAYFGDKMPASNSDWLEWEIKELDQPPSSFDLTKVQPVLESLILETVEELDRIRVLSTTEEWLLDQAAAMLRCRHLLRLCNRFFEKQTVVLKSILSQFDEIGADGGIYRWYQHRPKFAPLSSPMTMQIAIPLGSFRQKLGEEGEARLYQERLLYPSVLREQVEQSDGRKLPLEWSIVPPRLLWPFAMSINHGYLDPAWRTTLFTSEQIAEVPEVKIFFESIGITSQKDRIQILNEVYLQKIPDRWKTGGGPGVKLPQEDENHLIDILQKSHRSLCLRELIEEGLHKFYATSDLGEKERILKRLHGLYPWNSAVHLELSIFYDESENLKLAWDHILTCILLDVNNIQGWRSLSVILNRLGNVDDSKLAWAAYTVLNERMKK